MDGVRRPEGQQADRIALGTHLIIDVRDGTGLDDPDRVETALHQAVRAAKATLLDIRLHKFSPQGVTGVALLAESHITVHTWPEYGYGAFDTFMCGTADPYAVVEVLAKAFDTENVTVRALNRSHSP